jgi:hypothetical protein
MQKAKGKAYELFDAQRRTRQHGKIRTVASFKLQLYKWLII